MTNEQIREIEKMGLKMAKMLSKTRNNVPSITKTKKEGLEGLIAVYLQLQNLLVLQGYPIEEWRVSTITSGEIKDTLFLYSNQNNELLKISPDANKLLSIKEKEIKPVTTVQQGKKPFFSTAQIEQNKDIESLESLLTLILHYQLLFHNSKKQQESIINEIKYYFPHIRNYQDSIIMVAQQNQAILEWENVSQEERFQSLDRILSRDFTIDI